MLEFVIITIFVATFFNIFFKRFGFPTIIWYLLTWICISLAFNFSNISSSEDLKQVAEFWIVFLMFTIWLEFSVKTLFKMRNYVFIYWWLQFLVTSFVFFLFSNFLFWIDIKTSIIIATWLSLSSTAIVLKVLNDSRDINQKYWQKALWILLFQDLAVIPILLLISIFSQKEVNITYILFETLISSVVLIVILWFFWKYVLDLFLEKVYKTNSNEVFIWSVLLLVIWSSYFAHYLWLSYSIWAFLAWMMIAETHFKHQIEASLIPFRDLLLWIFFVTVWMQLNFHIIIENYILIIWLLLIIVLLKTLILFLILIFKTPKSTSLKTALSLFQIWEFAIVIFELAKRDGLLNSLYTQILIAVTILSMILTPLVLRYIDEIVSFFVRARFSEFTNIKELSNHIVLIWYGRVWRMVSTFLDEDKQEHIIIENELKSFLKAKKELKRVILWDAIDDNILWLVSIYRASHVIISMWFWHDVIPIVEKILKIIDKDKIIVKVSTFWERDVLAWLWMKNIIVETEKTALTVLDYMNE